MSTLLDFPIRIALVDGHEIVRAGVRLLIESRPRMMVVGEAGSRAEALRLVRREQPDLVVFEFFEEDKGLGCIAEMRDQSPQSRLLLLTGVTDAELHHRAIHLGAMGLVLKRKPPADIFRAIETVYEGGAWLDRSMVAQVLSRLSGPARQEESCEAAKIKTLTRRERDVIALLVQGLKNKQIARQLALSDVTVRHHLTSVYSKLAVADRFELLIYAYRHGLAAADAPRGEEGRPVGKLSGCEGGPPPLERRQVTALGR